VLKLCPEQLDDLSDEQIMDRWCALFKGPLLVQNYRSGESLSTAERSTVSDIVNVWRIKLASISWFMRCLNQPIARQANLEDKCTGKFWESRFKSQALKTEEAEYRTNKRPIASGPPPLEGCLGSQTRRAGICTD